jgi:hypothetical protein
MSSTLFARGINSQVGMKRKTDEMTTNITNLKKELLVMKQASEDVSSLKATVLSLTETVSVLQKKVDTLMSADVSKNSGPSLTISE